MIPKQQIVDCLDDIDDILVMAENHGWREDLVRVHLPHATILISPKEERLWCVGWEKGIEADFTLNTLKDQILSYITHECTPWPG